ncbi:Permuted papain-like amidase enzyme, YaeF/YiiX, C92 family [Nitrosospira sp. Nsp14]|uniref:YiiX/YebB-like N1pC/P60 family cysteine hydrolase n=1 Tax=Nitrosospira sp. Nsp14 TaxID=1855333 RepID=UPI0008E06483|nr:YiiX/YebB-like N1pC/P60 family cysteine hydrolase [Nitrosospira sp. Nsp14]SFH55937.1 Permuted papain-like amidase enzyme, YaeF/YiiX, C92 family [Nitrosospira sp. Nsp14]
MKRVKFENLKPGDIILTAGITKVGKAIRLSTRGIVSHAMICVQRGSIIDSTSDGVQARNLQRELFEDGEDVFAFRLRDELPAAMIAQVVDFARSEIGTRYSVSEAVRSVLVGPKPRNKREFCSRLVARAYQSVGIQLVADHDYCAPEDLRVSPLLIELSNLTEIVSAEEIAWRTTQPNPIEMMRDAQNKVLGVARSLDPNIENFQDLSELVQRHPEWDSVISQAYRDSRYLELWKHELQTHPWRYDLGAMENMQHAANLAALRAYCIETISEAYSGGIRFAVNLVYYQDTQKATEGETLGLLIDLYETLVQNDQNRREVARGWLLKHYPNDVKQHMERVEPHSDLWFSIVDRVEPRLGVIARASIEAQRSKEVCSSCGDEPACDYRITNSAEAMPGVPSLRLCDDCLSIRRGFGESLDLMD